MGNKLKFEVISKNHYFNSIRLTIYKDSKEVFNEEINYTSEAIIRFIDY